MVEPKNGQLPWWKRETVRLRGYTVATAIVGLLVLREYLSTDEAGYVLMAMAAIFGVYGIESSRNKTTPDELVIDEVIPAAAAGERRMARRMVGTPKGHTEEDNNDL